ncbi:unnamed protein product, partial [Didymodactylos carnosus]
QTSAQASSTAAITGSTSPYPTTTVTTLEPKPA